MEKALEQLVKTRMCVQMAKAIERARARAEEADGVKKLLYLSTIESMEEQYRRMCGGGE